MKSEKDKTQLEAQKYIPPMPGLTDSQWLTGVQVDLRDTLIACFSRWDGLELWQEEALHKFTTQTLMEYLRPYYSYDCWSDSWYSWNVTRWCQIFDWQMEEFMYKLIELVDRHKYPIKVKDVIKKLSYMLSNHNLENRHD